MSTDQPTKMWSGRFRDPLDPTFEAWQRSYPFDYRLLPQEVAASKAHARTIAAAGILNEAELQATLNGLDAVLTLADPSRRRRRGHPPLRRAPSPALHRPARPQAPHRP